MDRAEWLKKMRTQAEALYDHISPAYWVTFGMFDDTVHREFVHKLSERLGGPGTILDAGCGAGHYDAQLVEAGHTVLGIDQSGGMLARAREVLPMERYPRLRYQKMGLQEIEFQAEFDGAMCADAMEHVCPEDWAGIVARLSRALKPGGALYLTLDMPDWDEVREAYEQARAQGLPAVYGEVVDRVDAAYAQAAGLEWQEISGNLADPAVYHYYPSAEQVRGWLEQAGLTIVEEGTGDGYAHVVAVRGE